MSTTCVIDGSAFGCASTAAAPIGASSGTGGTLAWRPIICVSFAARLQ